MPETGYEDALSPEGNDQIRVRFTTMNGQVTRYTVQYEIRSAGQWVPVLRYDNAHGVPHRDRLDRHGEQIGKEWFSDLSYAEALNTAIDDITEDWRAFRQRFESE